MPTAQNLMDSVRATLNDEVGVVADLLWTDTELLEYINDAEREACIRMRILVDSVTTSTSRITIVNGTAIYPLDSKVVSVDRMKMASTSDPALHPVTRKVLDLTDPAWESETGVPRNYILEDIKTVKFLQLYPNPSAGGTMNLTVVRIPLAEMTAVGVPEIPEPLHRDLMNWMLFRAYTKQDSKVDQNIKTGTLTKEKFYLSQFEKVFGERQQVAPGTSKTSTLRD
jgi:hypothetical protein